MSDPILIWGSGAIGGILGAYLARAGEDVVMVDIVPEHVEAMRTGGLRIEGPIEEFTQVLTAFSPDELQGQFRRIFLCVKAHHTKGALDMLLPHLAADGYIVSAQNGLNEIEIAAHVGSERTVGCFVNFGADWLGPGQILFGNRAAVAVGELDGRLSPRVDDAHRLLSVFEPDAVATSNIWGYLWGKMGYGALLFGTALTNESMAAAMALPEYALVYKALGHEVMRLAAIHDVEPLGFNGFDPQAFLTRDEVAMDASLARMVAHNSKTAKTHSGIWRDLAIRKRKTEVDAQIGVMLDLAAEAGLSLRAVPRLVELIHDIEEGRRPLSLANLDEMVLACS